MAVAQQNSESILGRPPKPDHLKFRNRVVIQLNDDQLAALDEFIAGSPDFADRNDFGREVLMESIGYKRQGLDQGGKD